MVFKKFARSLTLRIIWLMLTVVLLTYMFTLTGYMVTTSIVILMLISQCFLIYRFVLKTNNELTRFLEAARYADYSKRFEFKEMGAGFADLGNTFTEILERFQLNRASQEEELKHLKAMIEHVPVPIVSIHSGGLLTLRNNAARRLFGSNPVSHVEDLSIFGGDVVEQLQAVQVGERRLVIFEVDGMEQQLSISATELVIAGKHEKLLSMQNIQSELDGAQLQAWQDLVRVLTHEIMNSITPVASLAKTAVDLLEDAKRKLSSNQSVCNDLNDVSDAVNTVARRSDGLMKFVGSYRRLTRLPPPDKKLVKLQKLLSQVEAIATQHWAKKHIAFGIKILPSKLDVMIDQGMIEQLLINLLQNAEQALIGIDSPSVSLSAYLNKRGHVVIDVEDNGHGVPEDNIKKIFVPFFTTKREGSGVGLALTRQVMIAHGGNVKLTRAKSGGALFRLTF